MTAPGKKRLVVFISGHGSNLQALIDATADGRIDADIAAVLSNRKAAYGLTRARDAGIRTLYHPASAFRDLPDPRRAYDAALAEITAALNPDFVILAGFMRILTTAFLDHFPGQIVNLHPALPGHFPGTHAIERAYEAFKAGDLTHTGVMVHKVVEEVDAGPVLVSEVVPIEAHDTLGDLEARIHAVEHRLLVEAVASL